MKVRKNVSLDDDIWRKATKKGKSMGFNFSAYVTYLINRDLNGETAITTTTNNELEEKKKKAMLSIMGD